MPKRVPITEAHRHGVTGSDDGALARVPGTGDVRVAGGLRAHSSPCSTASMRYDLKLAYKRTENVKAEKGYSGPAVVCAVKFTPVAGFIPSRSGIKYLAKSA